MLEPTFCYTNSKITSIIRIAKPLELLLDYASVASYLKIKFNSVILLWLSFLWQVA